MDSNIKFEAERLICCDCKQPFVFSAGERRYYFDRGLAPPKRCRVCRQKRRGPQVYVEGVRHDRQ